MNKINKGILLSPFPIIFEGLPIYKPTLKEIYYSIGFENYHRATNLLTITDIEIEKYYKSIDQPIEELEPFLWLLNAAKSSEVFLLELSFAFFTYLKKQVVIKDDNFCFFDEETGASFFLTRNNFSNFQKIIRQINGDDDFDEDEREIITDNLRMKKKFLEKRKKLKEAKEKQRLKAKEQNKGNEIGIPDMISSLCIYNVGYNLTNVWDLTIYQLYNQFQKCQRKDDYDKNYQALLAGADKTKIKMKSWIKD